MRLVCPNCSAQYEVPDNVIPVGGRDVQCSNCGHTWFQSHPDDDPELAEDLNAPVPGESWEPEVGEDDAREEADVDEEFEPEAPGPELRRRELDPSVTEILREEAERETRARAAQADPLESQPELGLETATEDEEERRARQSRERMARMRGEDPDAELAAAAAASAASSRRDLLPDIDEINSTLRAASEREEARVEVDKAEEAPLQEIERTNRFNRGFLFAIIVFAILAVLYFVAPTLKQNVPALAGALDLYVGFVDGLRDALNGLVAKGLGALGGLGEDAAS